MPYSPTNSRGVTRIERIKSFDASWVGDATAGGTANTQQFMDARRALKGPVRLATNAALPTNTYSNGTSGVGATLTATANGALTVDGVAVATGDRVLVKNEATQTKNGIYTVTATGGTSAAYVLTRAADFDRAAEILPNSTCMVNEGTANAALSFRLTNTGAVTVGTTSITFAAISTATGVTSVTAGAGVSVSASTGAVTISNTGVTSVTAGTGVSVSASTGAVTIGLSAAPTYATITTLSTNYNLNAEQTVFVKLTATPAANLVLPNAPLTGARVVIKDAGANFDTYPCTVIPNSSGTDKIENDTGMLLNQPRMSVVLVYDGSGGWWII